jgi:exodeoxyribonuclease VII large subunit
VVSAIGHEPDTPIVDLVADLRASTPTDAAKRIVPDAAAEMAALRETRLRLRRMLVGRLQVEQAWLDQMRSRPAVRNAMATLGPHVEQVRLARQRLREAMARRLDDEQRGLDHAVAQCRALSPRSTLRRGYAIATVVGAPLTSIRQAAVGSAVHLTLVDGALTTRVEEVEDTASQARKETS